MAKVYDYHFTVEGSGEFPLDMLRHDCCYPRNESDSNVAQYRGEKRRVTLTAPARASYWQPTVGRWASFGWKMISADRELS